MENDLYAWMVVLGVIFRYNLGLSQACLLIGTTISDSNHSTGFQDAITPPISSNIALITGAAILAICSYSVFEFSWGTGGATLFFFIISSILSRAVIPKPDSPHYLKKVYFSMTNRYADFQKKGDIIRAEAIKILIERLEATYSAELSKI